MSGPLHLSSTLQAAAHRQRQQDLHRQRREQQGMSPPAAAQAAARPPLAAAQAARRGRVELGINSQVSTGSGASSKAWRGLCGGR